MKEIRNQLEEMIQEQFLGILKGIIENNENIYIDNTLYDDLLTSDGQLKYELKMEPVV